MKSEAISWIAMAVMFVAVTAGMMFREAEETKRSEACFGRGGVWAVGACQIEPAAK